MRLHHVLGCAHLLSWVQLFVTPWTVALQAPRSTGFSQQEYWNLLSFPPPGDLPHPGTESKSLASPTVAGRFFTTVPPGKPQLPWYWWCLFVSLHIGLFIFQHPPFPFPFSCYLFNFNDRLWNKIHYPHFAAEETCPGAEEWLPRLPRCGPSPPGLHRIIVNVGHNFGSAVREGYW